MALLESAQSLAADRAANRGTDWQPRETDTVKYSEIPTSKLKYGEARYYFLRDPRWLLRVRNYDVIIFGGWESPAYWLLLLAARVFGLGRVGFYESTLSTMKNTRGPVAWVRRLFFATMHAVVVPGPDARGALLHIGISDDRIVEGVNAVDVKAFHLASLRVTSQTPLTVGHSFLYVGQLIQRKRVKNVIDAFESIALPEDRLSIVGSGEQADYLHQKAAKCGSSITFRNHVDNYLLPEVMAGHETLVLASSEEVWGLVVNEALAAGMHVVVSANCGVVPSVLGMQGVFITKPDLSDLESQMHNSRNAWMARIQEPQILVHTPERFSESFDRAIDMVR
ncbi:glycosyltransferase family 4 protein [Arthrobacter sp. PsM3]|uniref:glycosyltransferase family 4 protein n=1 Tax=Arthrobacter sp. PsM3 TaxID=3030531 RepID=UPI00263B30C6|nr:glycosyltransferase family 4 protein [Arthrobacter sp. PsM3]MDN4645144.1 glycosyltransferase family 4 protein [Arthrobacter sp. PsM3]